MKTVSQLNAAGYFTGPVIADESPLEPGVYLVPGGAIDVPPPTVPAGKVALRQGSSWVFVDPTPQAPLPEGEPVTPAAQIDALERQYQLARPVREFMLISMEVQAAAQGINPTQLRERNPGYRRVKELDEQIAALRALL